MRIKSTYLATLFLCFLGTLSFAQKQTPLDIAMRYMKQNAAQWNLTNEDIADMVVSDTYETKHNRVTHVFFKQRYAGVEVYNAINGVHVKSDEVMYANNRFLPNLTSLVNTTSKSLSAYQAIEAAASHLQLDMLSRLELKEQEGSHLFVYDGGNISKSDITLKPVYQINKNNKLILSWELFIYMPNSHDFWRLAVDANTGEIVDQHNHTHYDDFHSHGSSQHSHGHSHDHDHSYDCDIETFLNANQVETALLNNNTNSNVTGGTYNVFARPVESPAYGDRSIIINPADPLGGSPYGWHDIDGQEGAEYTITRGNNVHAFQDRDGNNAPSGDEPDGGSELMFDFPLDFNDEPDAYQEAAVTQLFYFVNTMHDFAYAYGFDEASGNFQQNNYGNGGTGGDPVIAQAQDDFDNGSINNAFYTPVPDGLSPTIGMFLWTRGGSDLLQVSSPAGISGGYETGTANYGPAVSADPVSGVIALAFDASSNPNLGCNEIVNADEVNGKVAMVDRGSCFFEQKTVNAEAAGAIALIICNFEDAVAGMAGVPELDDPSIPTVMLKSSDCALIRNTLSAGIEVEVTLQFEDQGGPTNIDGDFDNGVIAHEYGHGIHGRLTGGPSTASCYSNDEQMGEGYADFFALITTVEPGDIGETPRGVGAYVSSSNPNGGGIRRLPYSTDSNVNDQVYDDIIGTTAPHPLGEIWTGCIWDLYWAMVDVYGFDEDQIHGTGGNNMAIQLVMDGLKIQACNPGFIDARDGIIAADILNYDGANECLIWEVFAKRGLGWGASQGSNNDRNDGIMSFEPRPDCIKELKIAKSSTDLIEAGDDFEITVVVTNHKEETASGVVITDEIPEGASYIAGSTSGANEPTATADLLTFEIGDLATGESVTITYNLSSADELVSVSSFYDGAEDAFDQFGIDALEGVDIWNFVGDDPITDALSWFVPNTETDNDQVLFTLNPIELDADQPVLRFNHRYITEPGSDGGIIQISTDGFEWQTIEAENIFRGSYRGQLAYAAFAIPNISGFWGNSNGVVTSYVELEEWAGESVYLRFRFGSDANTAAQGWTVDDIEIIDMYNYNSEACVTSNEGDTACDEASAKGTVVEVGDPTSITSIDTPTNVSVFPNPAKDLLNVAISTEQAQEVMVTLVNASGVQLFETRVNIGMNGQIVPVDVSGLPAGFYFVQVAADQQLAVEKVILK